MLKYRPIPILKKNCRNVADWWTQATLANYLDRAQCFIDQYGNFTVPSGSHVNGVTTQGENIADNGKQHFLPLFFKSNNQLIFF